ncbi:MAG: ATP-binding cassette domain-containing protein [candidate division KSB1 bacterium]|nr:ATP-binding cassette domain-containing protein [candidate division KSB1 bacterium]
MIGTDRMKLELQKVSFSYDTPGEATSQPVLMDMSFSLNFTDTVGVIGPSGAGKSTFLQILAGLEKPDSGSVLLDGRDVHRDRQAYEQLRRHLGIAFQFPENQLFEATVADDVAFGPRNQGLSEAEVRQRVQTALAIVGLPPDEFMRRAIEQLSQGEKRRVAIAGVLAMQPQWLVLDEPTAGLDPATRRNFIEFLRDYHQQGRGLVIASHDLDFLVQVVQRIYVMDQGRWIADFTPGELESRTDADWPIRLPRVIRLRRRLHEMGLTLPANLFHPETFLQFLERIPNL